MRSKIGEKNSQTREKQKKKTKKEQRQRLGLLIMLCDPSAQPPHRIQTRPEPGTRP